MGYSGTSKFLSPLPFLPSGIALFWTQLQQQTQHGSLSCLQERFRSVTHAYYRDAHGTRKTSLLYKILKRRNIEERTCEYFPIQLKPYSSSVNFERLFLIRFFHSFSMALDRPT